MNHPRLCTLCAQFIADEMQINYPKLSHSLCFCLIGYGCNLHIFGRNLKSCISGWMGLCQNNYHFDEPVLMFVNFFSWAVNLKKTVKSAPTAWTQFGPQIAIYISEWEESWLLSGCENIKNFKLCEFENNRTLGAGDCPYFLCRF